MGAFDDVLEANRAYAESFGLLGLAAPAARGLALLTCIDSRIEPLAMLGLEPGDAKIMRNAGARATDDAVRSLALATRLLRVTRIMVVHHTDCAMAGATAEELRERLVESGLDREVANAFDPGHIPDPAATLLADVARLRETSLIPDSVEVAGFTYDVTTGLLTPATHAP